MSKEEVIDLMAGDAVFENMSEDEQNEWLYMMGF